nr:hypothetical protein [Tanacetum cinerariifolium]
MKCSPSYSHAKRNPKPREETKRSKLILRNATTKNPIRYKEEDERNVSSRSSSTLKECLLASPNNHYAINPSKILLQVFTSEDQTEDDLATSRIGFSVDKRDAKLRNVDEDEEASFSARMLERSESRVSKKKVSFRFPQEADIFEFCSDD